MTPARVVTFALVRVAVKESSSLVSHTILFIELNHEFIISNVSLFMTPSFQGLIISPLSIFRETLPCFWSITTTMMTALIQL